MKDQQKRWKCVLGGNMRETAIEIEPTFFGVKVKTATLTADDCGGKEISLNQFNCVGTEILKTTRVIISNTE